MNDEDIERALRETALRPRDDAFTRRVLAALPPRRHRHGREMRRSVELASRFGLASILVAAAVRWYSAGPGGLDAALVLLMVAVPAFAALSWACGPLVPGPIWRRLWRSRPGWR